MFAFRAQGGGGYWFFRHATWNGLTLADTVFPSFIWSDLFKLSSAKLQFLNRIMGTSMAIVFDSAVKKGVSKSLLDCIADERALQESRWGLLYKIMRRAIILFGLGLFVSNGAVKFEDLRCAQPMLRLRTELLLECAAFLACCSASRLPSSWSPS